MCPGSGGWTSPRPGSPVEKELPPIQLFNMTADCKENNNLEKNIPKK